MPRQIRRPEFRSVEAEVRKKERERCAKICETHGVSYSGTDKLVSGARQFGQIFAAAIRAQPEPT